MSSRSLEENRTQKNGNFLALASRCAKNRHGRGDGTVILFRGNGLILFYV